MKIRWLADTTGLNLKPTWEVKGIRVHTVPKMLQPDGVTRKDTMVCYFICTPEQLRKLTDEYEKKNFSMGMLGLNVIVLEPNATLWTLHPPKGYESAIKGGTYHAFEIVEEEDGREASRTVPG